MKSNKKYIPFFIAIILLIAFFIAGWVWGKNNPDIFSKLSFTTPVLSINDQKDLLDRLETKILEIVKNYPNRLPQLLNCTQSSTKDCVSAEVQTPPYQWIQYGNAYYNSFKNTNIEATEILKDLNTYPSKDFDWRLYQYGDLLIENPGKYPELEKKYLEITDSLYSIKDGKKVDFKFYTDNDKPATNLLIGSIYGNKTALLMAMMDYGTRVNTVANAYIISKDSKYQLDSASLLNVIHGLGYYEDAISKKEPELKSSTCYTILSDVYLFKATKDRTYLGFIDYLNNKDSFTNLFAADSSDITADSKDPMKTLPCLDAITQLKKLDPQNSSKYDKDYNLILSFLIKNKVINMDSKSDYYGFARISNGKYDINSSAWLVKILSDYLKLAN